MANQAATSSPLLSVHELHTYHGAIRAVDGVSFDLAAGETLGVVGESGSGKTTLGRSILRLIEPVGGQILFDGVDVLRARGADLRRVQRNVQAVFQDPIGSLNPRMRVGAIIAEPLEVHHVGDCASRREQVAALLTQVGLRPDDEHRYPHEFSGGQRQRIGIARALALGPKLVILDEAVSALDVSIQGQILNLLSDLKAALGLTYLFIAHNLAVVRHFSDRVAVMHRGRILELAAADQLFDSPQHAYTRSLLSAVPDGCAAPSDFGHAAQKH
jgi:ABC-type oligopeptide transport system ATPase subunit